MSDDSLPEPARPPSSTRLRWGEWRDMAFTLVGWTVLVVGVGWVISRVMETVLLYLLAGIVAYAIAPVVRRLEQFVDHAVAVTLAYLGLLCALVGLLASIVVSATREWSAVGSAVHNLAKGPHTQPIYGALEQLTLSEGQIQQSLSFIDGFLHPQAGSPASLLSVGMVVANVFVSAIFVGIISVYFVTDGAKFRKTLLDNIPTVQRERASFFIQTLDRVIGGYIRAQLLLSLLIGLLVGVGMWALRVPGEWNRGIPHPIFLGAVAFVLEFVPMVGLWITGAVCVLVALTQSPTLALMALIYFVVVSTIEANVAAPNIMARAVDVHPMVSLFALLAGAQLFGPWGALFAAPVAGLAQALVSAILSGWRAAHPEQFPPDDGEGEGDPVLIGAPSGSPGAV